jgi:hypothetical protein
MRSDGRICGKYNVINDQDEIFSQDSMSRSISKLCYSDYEYQDTLASQIPSARSSLAAHQRSD